MKIPSCALAIDVYYMSVYVTLCIDRTCTCINSGLGRREITTIETDYIENKLC